jgi:alkanesulfonate monooxygenase SsuD/methylene tetrahydromethanopterin reductase-like flavin-dependent oxidoreductase (luciferase family)
MKKAWEILEHRLIVHLSFSVEESSATEHRFLQAGEFLTNCRGLFDRYQRPEFDVEGESAGAAFVAIKYADCLWRRPAHPPQVYADALPVLHFGKQVGLVTSAVARETRGQALDTAARLLPETLAESLKDAASWVTPSIWRANVADGQEQRAMLVGSFDEVAGAMYGFKQRSILQFLIRTPMEQRDVECFGMNVLPRIRDLESRGRRSAQQITFIGGEC